MKPYYLILAVPVLTVTLAASASAPPAWPNDARPEIFTHASGTVPPALRQLLVDMDAILSEPCTSVESGQLASSAEAAIRELTRPQGDLVRATAYIRESGCAAMALNDPGNPAIRSLIGQQKDRFAVVFYGWHPTLLAGDLAGFLRAREAEHRRLMDRFGRSSELPNLSEQVELSPEFGQASIAFSHAVTDVANVWLYIWTSANGAR